MASLIFQFRIPYFSVSEALHSLFFSFASLFLIEGIPYKINWVYLVFVLVSYQ